MGLPMSLLGKLGIPGVRTMATSQVYERYFKEKPITNIEDFHISFVEFCKDFNEALPGKHYDVSSRVKIQEFFENEWVKCSTPEEKREKFFKFMEENLREEKTNPRAMIVMGVAAPAAAMALKRAGENFPAVKKFRLNLIPDCVFVPSCTLVALVGVKVLQVKSHRPS